MVSGPIPYPGNRLIRGRLYKHDIIFDCPRCGPVAVPRKRYGFLEPMARFLASAQVFIDGWGMTHLVNFHMSGDPRAADRPGNEWARYEIASIQRRAIERANAVQRATLRRGANGHG